MARVSNKERRNQSNAFLKYLCDQDLLKTKEKEALRNIFNSQFKREWKAQHGGPVMNFSSSLFQLKKDGFVRMNKQNIVSFCEGKIQQSTVQPTVQTTDQPVPSTSQTAARQVSPRLQRTRSLVASVPVAVDQFITSRPTDDSTDERDSSPEGPLPAPASSQIAVALPPGIRKSGGFFVCEWCRIMVNSKAELTSHLDGKKHKVHKILLDLEEHRNEMAKECDDIEIITKYDKPQATVQMDVEEGKTDSIEFQILNKGRGLVTLVACELLRKLRMFQLDDVKQVCDGIGTAEIFPGGTYTVTLSIKPSNIGRFHRPVAFAFTRSGSKVKQLHIVRYISVRCHSPDMTDLMPKSPFKQPPRATKVAPASEIIDGIAPNRLYAENTLERTISLDEYYIPKSVRHVMNHGKKPWPDMDEEDKRALAKVKALSHSKLGSENYYERLSLLLHIEELQMEVDIRKYDMENVTMNICKEVKHWLELKVPGLAENRPSVLRGDCLYVRILGADDKPSGQEYRGHVHEVRPESLCFNNDKLREKFLPNMKFNVRFTFNRLPIKLQHRAAQLAEEHSLEKILFPEPPTICKQGLIFPVDKKLKLKNRLLEKNHEQMTAVQHILAGSSRPAPYLVFGPPGTGKTVTIVEAMKQVLECISGSHVLACAPSNSAADLITTRLLQHVDKKDIYRLNASSRAWDTVEESVKPCCNYNSRSRGYVFPKKEELMKYRVLVCTLVTAGRLTSANFPPGHFTHIFIDESGHAVEPEAVITIAGILESDINLKHGGQVVLAGDPKQLGPVLRSPVAIKCGLDISLLERLMSTKVYERNEDTERYNVKVLTKLLKNYRSHPDIMSIPNSKFYQNELQACADELDRQSLCRWDVLPKKGFPILFHGIVGQDMREERSPSFFNPEEVVQVERYVKELLEARGGGINIKQEHIGIITPYRKQVKKIMKRCEKNRWNKIKVGSVEEFQGQERRVVIISTVRSSADHLPMDSKYKLGFVSNPKRFNVAITRAKALVIIVGNPNVLCRDQYWNSFLTFCIENGAYKGCDFEKLEDQFEDILERFKAIKLDELDMDTIDLVDPDSNVQQQIEPEWRAEN